MTFSFFIFYLNSILCILWELFVSHKELRELIIAILIRQRWLLLAAKHFGTKH